MKVKYILIIAVLLLTHSIGSGQIDVTVKPEPLPSKDFPFPQHTEKTLKNGLKVFVVEDNEQPIISMRLLVQGGGSTSGAKPGLADMTAAMLTKGASKLSAYDIASKIDGLGASLSANSSLDYITVNTFSLKKYFNEVLEIFADVVMKPTFPKAELEKLKPQFKAQVQHDKSQTSSLASALAAKAMFGDNHPYSARMSENSIEQIEISDIEAYFKKHFVPNNATLAIVGDVKASQIIATLEKALSGWKAGASFDIQIPSPKPHPIGVYFVERPASVQSSILVSTQTVPYGDQDYETLRLAAGVMGSGFGGRLFRTLRETYSFTYSPFGYQTGAKYSNRFVCGADVRNSATDSAISVIREQLTMLALVAPTAEETDRIKRYTVGSYLTSFEDSDFIASLIQNANFYGIPLSVVKGFPQRYMAISPYSVQRAAERYMNPRSAYIAVAGSAEVKSKLEQFGKVYEYNQDMEPITGEMAKFEKVSLTPQELIARYRKAIGGEDAISKIETITLEGKADMDYNGNLINGILLQKSKYPDKAYMFYDFKTLTQEMWINGEDVFMKISGGAEKVTGSDASKLIFAGTMLNYPRALEFAKSSEILGKQGRYIALKIVFKGNFERILYFDEQSNLLNRVEYTESTPQGSFPIIERYADYVDFGGVKLPTLIETKSTLYSVSNKAVYKINEAMDDALFAPSEH